MFKLKSVYTKIKKRGLKSVKDSKPFKPPEGIFEAHRLSYDAQRYGSSLNKRKYKM